MACESDRAMSASHASVMVFEGFIDFLSYLSLANNIHPVSDTVVLNSVVNLSKAVPFLNRHSVIHAFFDTTKPDAKRPPTCIVFVPAARSSTKAVSTADTRMSTTI